MKKNAIIDIIEMQLLLQTFRDAESIPTSFIDLLKQKHAGVERELSLLGFWTDEAVKKTDDRPELTADIKAKPAVEAEQPPVVEVGNAVQVEVSKPSQVPVRPQSQKPQEVTMPKPVVVDAPAAHKKNVDDRPMQQAPTVGSPDVRHANAPRPMPRQSEAERPQFRQRNAADIANYGTPVNDVRKAFGINDRFLFQRELFGGDNGAMEAAIEGINASRSFDDAHSYLLRTFGWDEAEPTTDAFMKAVHRRFL